MYVCVCMYIHKYIYVYVYIDHKYILENATGKARSLIIDFVDSSNDYPKF
jgi:hypothetical protein